ncbi:MAG: sigma-54-dependent Fis family transcriptional regulator [Bdellovibrionales bacterium]|nr:sigma-54-dependent Fis family transcriptional regulator [Bdellovibrionales bacterium]
MKSNLNILIVDDEQELRRSIISVLYNTFKEFLITTVEAQDGLEAIQKVEQNSFDLVFMDVRMPHLDGISALKKIKEISPQSFVVILTAHSNLQDAVECIKQGAYDYIEKPLEAGKLKSIVEKALEARSLVSEIAISNPIFDDDIDSEFVGTSQKMKEVYGLIYKLSHVDTTVLIRGENGTGKELVAKAIHHNSPRKHDEFIALNCGAIPENLMESEIFGHEKGAFTGAETRKIGKFQLANSGTLFLDEIGELKPELQVKLLRVLQERKFTPVGGNREITTNARVIAATNQNIEKMIEEGEFREDLFYRLNVMPIFLPPLRERIDDLQQLVSFFIKKFAKKHNSSISEIEKEAFNLLTSYRWPGNIRELENVIERAFIVENNNILTKESLPENIRNQNQQIEIGIPKNYVGPLDFDQFKVDTEKEFIIQALKANNGKINKTVAQANIPKNTLLRKIKKYGINVKEFM